MASGTISEPFVKLSYSTSEQFTGTYWIDGKPIYSVTVYIASLPNAKQQDYDFNIYNVEEIIKFEGFAKITTSGSSYNPCIVHVGTNANNGISCIPYRNLTDGRLSVQIHTLSSDRRNSHAYITCYYTKTTD